ncbi:MAG: hypothetical protein CME32_01300 [Gimesia sp.]|nr:hypothetical protein [Gimesia sp.]
MRKIKSLQIDERYICATNRNLKTEVGSGRFRNDLYYRLGVIHIELPPLRDRGEDIVLLADHFLKTATNKPGRPMQFSLATLDSLLNYSWLGNIRELKNVVEHAVVLARTETIGKDELPGTLLKPLAERNHGSGSAAATAAGSRDEAIENAEHQYLTNDGNISQAALQAVLSRQGLHKLLNKHNISAADFRSKQFLNLRMPKRDVNCGTATAEGSAEL